MLDPDTLTVFEHILQVLLLFIQVQEHVYRKQIMPKISVILPNFNHADYIDDALRSMLMQTFDDWECIIIDDASTDKSLEIIKKFIKQDSRFQLIKLKENKGLSAARNAGLEIANGDYIGFLDADDAFTPNALEIMYMTAEMNRADIVGGFVTIIPDDFKLIQETVPKSYGEQNFSLINNPSGNLIFFLKSTGTNLTWVWRRLFKREIIGEKRFLEGVNQIEDLLFILEVLASARRIIETRSVVCWHRFSNGSLTRKDMSDDQIDWISPGFKYINKNISPLYPKDTMYYIFSEMFRQNVMNQLVIPYLKNHDVIAKVANNFREIYKTPAMPPLKLLKFRSRIILWFCIKFIGRR